MKNIRLNSTVKATLLITIATALLSSVLILGRPQTAHANGWEAGRIIDDYLFTNENAATAADIQDAIEDLNPTCDTWGTQPSEFGGPDYDGNGVVTRAEYGQSRGNPAPFTCLKNYRENPTTGENNYGGQGTPAGSRTAAQLIVDAGKKHDINPQVLLVMLRRESALLNDQWPFLSQYQYAMGAHCPDGPNGANCDPDYAGFAKQMDEGARLFRYYLDNMDASWWPYKNIGTHNVLWNAVHSYFTNGQGNSVQCGGSNVNIQTRGTAALYTYTPYQPNNAALNAYPAAVPSGSGFDHKCAAYGNRNFFYFFQEMFGSTRGVDNNVRLATHLEVFNANPKAGDTITATFTVVNNNSYDVTIQQLRVNGRDPDNKEATFGPAVDVTVPANGVYIYSRNQTVDKPGNYRFWIQTRHQNAWTLTWPTSSVGFIRERNITVAQNPFISSDLTLDYTNVATGQNVNASFNIDNQSNYDYVIPQIKVAGRDPDGKVVNFPTVVNATVPANGTYTYSENRSFDTDGEHNFWITTYNGDFWRNNFPASLNSSIDRTETASVESFPSTTQLSGSLSLDHSTAYNTEEVTATFEVTNTASYDVNIGNIKVSGRDSNGGVFNFAEQSNVVITAGSTYTYSDTRVFDKEGDYNFWIANFNNGRWRTDYPAGSSSSITRTETLSVEENPMIVAGLELSPANPLPGEDTTATFTIRNFSDHDVEIDNIKVAGRDDDSNVVNFDTHYNFTVPANGTYTYSETRNFNNEGVHNFWVTSFFDGRWSSNYPVKQNNSVDTDYSVNIDHDLFLITDLSVSNSTPAPGEAVTATFQLRNISDEDVILEHIKVAGRSPTNAKTNYDSIDSFTISANSTYTYSETRTFTESGLHNFWINAIFRGSWDNSYPPSDTSGLIRALTIDVD